MRRKDDTFIVGIQLTVLLEVIAIDGTLLKWALFCQDNGFQNDQVIIILMITWWHNRLTNLSIAPFSVLQRLRDKAPGQLTSFHYFNNNNETAPRDNRRIHVMGLWTDSSGPGASVVSLFV